MSSMRLKFEFPTYNDLDESIKSLLNIFIEDSSVYFRAEFDWSTDQLLHMSAMLYPDHTTYTWTNNTEIGAILYDDTNDLFSPEHCIDGGSSVNDAYGGEVDDIGKMDVVRNLRCINSIGDVNTVLAQANTYIRFYEKSNHGGYYDYLSSFDIPEMTIPVKITPYVNNSDVIDATDKLPSFLSDLQDEGIVKIPIDKTSVDFKYTFDFRTTSFTVKDVDSGEYYDVFYKVGIVKFSKAYYLNTNISLPDEGIENYWEVQPEEYTVSKSTIVSNFLYSSLYFSQIYSSDAIYIYLNGSGMMGFPDSIRNSYFEPCNRDICYSDRIDFNDKRYPGKQHYFFKSMFVPIVDLDTFSDINLYYKYEAPCVGIMYMRLYNQDGTIFNLNLDHPEIYMRDSEDSHYHRFEDFFVLFFTELSEGFIPTVSAYYFTPLGEQDTEGISVSKNGVYPLYLPDGSRALYKNIDTSPIFYYIGDDDGKEYTTSLSIEYINDNNYLSIKSQYQWTIQLIKMILFNGTI